MQTDTIIGIAGAVVLVAVMVGVFAYEYNNAPEEAGGDNGLTDEQRKALFNATYDSVGLNAEDDIDWDGTPNWQDDDIDDDGKDNRNDTEVAVNKDVSGTVPQRTVNDDPVSTYEFQIGEGFRSGSITITWEVTGGPLGPVDNLQVAVTGPGDIACENGNGEATCTLAAAGVGRHTIEVSHAQQATVGPKSYDGTITVVY